MQADKQNIFRHELQFEALSSPYFASKTTGTGTQSLEGENLLCESYGQQLAEFKFAFSTIIFSAVANPMTGKIPNLRAIIISRYKTRKRLECLLARQCWQGNVGKAMLARQCWQDNVGKTTNEWPLRHCQDIVILLSPINTASTLLVQYMALP